MAKTPQLKRKFKASKYVSTIKPQYKRERENLGVYSIDKNTEHAALSESVLTVHAVETWKTQTHAYVRI